MKLPPIKLQQQQLGDALASDPQTSLDASADALSIPADIAAQQQRLLATELSLAHALELGFLRNSQLQQAYWQLVQADAKQVQQSQLPWPSFRWHRLKEETGYSTELGLSSSILRLLSLPLQRELAQQDYSIAQLELAQHVSRYVQQVQLAWYDAVAAQQQLDHSEQLYRAMQASATIAKRMREIGNASQLEWLAHQTELAELALMRLQAQQLSATTMATLKQVLGVWPDTPLQLPRQLPALPSAIAPVDPKALIAAAQQQRFDLALERHRLARQATVLGLSGHAKRLSMLNLSIEANLQHQAEQSLGLDLALPEASDAIARQAQAAFRQQQWRLYMQYQHAQHQVQQALSTQQHQLQVALLYQQQLMPLAQQTTDETLLRYNGMLVGVFDLMQQAKQQWLLAQQSIGAARDYWHADTRLAMTMLGAPQDLPSSASTASTPAMPAAEKPAH
jgi:outer membrane protein TolC